MYPSDDGPIRLRLLIAQSRTVRERLENQVAELKELRARRLEPVPSQTAVEAGDLWAETRDEASPRG